MAKGGERVTTATQDTTAAAPEVVDAQIHLFQEDGPPYAWDPGCSPIPRWR